ncbi:MAG: GIY-YIG nuclease family protein, partial [Candidatus Acidiferrales bacterium]
GYEPEGREFESLRARHSSYVSSLRPQKRENGATLHWFHADLTQRLGQHNSEVTKSTKNRGAWLLVHQESFATRAEAMRREKQLKSGQGREELKRILSASETGNSTG